MAKEIKVTFEDSGVYEGFANTYTLDNSITYYFSFDRDYRVQLTNNAITLQEYRNAGAWYPIDIITKFELAEISGGGTGDVTQQWVKDNFVLKSGDTMTGSLRFNFGGDDMIVIGQSSTTKRGLINFNGNMYFKNEENKTIASFVSTTNLTLNLFQASNGYNSNIYFRNYEAGKTGLSRSISYSEFRNNDADNTWTFNGKFQANNTWWFKSGGVYFDTWAYWRSNDIINTIIQNNGGIRVYNGMNIAVHEMGSDAKTNYYSVYKYNGRDTVSFVDGQDPQYRITGYNNFASSVECYDKITVKTEGQNTAKVILSKGNLTIYDDNGKAQYALSPNRFDIYNGKAVICHNGSGNDAQATFQYNGIRTYNYKGSLFEVNISDGYYSNYSKRFDVTGNYVSILAKSDSMNITSPQGNVIISDAQGIYGRSSNSETNTYIRNVSHNIYVQTSQTGASDARRDELTALLDLFKIVYNILESAGIPGASQLAEYTSDTVLWIYDNQNGVLKPTITKIRNLIHN